MNAAALRIQLQQKLNELQNMTRASTGMGAVAVAIEIVKIAKQLKDQTQKDFIQ